MASAHRVAEITGRGLCWLGTYSPLRGCSWQAALPAAHSYRNGLYAICSVLPFNGAPDIEVLCCGASALCVLGLLSRSTMDVDVLGIVVQDRDLDPCEVFPAEMERAIANAGRELGLADDWFNGSASRMLERGVPEGTLERSLEHRRSFGPCLTVRFLDRRDQVAMKLFAAMDPVDGIRHLKDLEEISPEAEEISHALMWMGGWESSSAFRAKLKAIVSGLGFEDLASSNIRR